VFISERIMKYLIIKLLFFCCVLFVFFQACRHEPLIDTTDPGNNPDPYTGECHPDTIYFNKDLLPLLVSSCARSGCHDADTQANGVRLTDYESVIETGDVRPGRPEDSDLYEVLVDDDPDDRMPPPPNEPLSSNQIEQFYTWIMQGALDLDCNQMPDCPADQIQKWIEDGMQNN
jgi:hypothetical protein